MCCCRNQSEKVIFTPTLTHFPAIGTLRSKNVNAYANCIVPEDIEKMIKGTRHTNPFEVIHVLEDYFNNLQMFIPTTTLKISLASWIQITNNPGIVKVWKNFNEVAP